MWIVNILLFVMCLELALCTSVEQPIEDDEEYDPMHPQLMFFNPHRNEKNGRNKRDLPHLEFESKKLERDPDYWNNNAQQTLRNQLNKNKLNTNLAKNIILMLGDGMSIATQAATRVYMGSEDKVLSFEEFPYAGLSKTYCSNVQVADSACTSTAYLAGIKANYGTIGVSGHVILGDCKAENDTLNHVYSIAKWAQNAGMGVGLITTTAVTHASPAGIYAHTADRNWESDTRLLKDGGDTKYCTDIATQLIKSDVGQNLKVILGGGREHFLPKNVQDIEGKMGKRSDGVNLIEKWKEQHAKKGHAYEYVETVSDLRQVSIKVDYLLGLFDSYHMDFRMDSDHSIKPSLIEMVDKALDIMETQNKGYFLFIEGGRIDHGHHYTLANRALDETVEFHKAVEYVRKRTNEDDTLIVVTADHSHTMTISGYSSRENDILGINNGQLGIDNKPYATISYANGPGYKGNLEKDGTRKLLTKEQMTAYKYESPTMVPLGIETHGGDDVGVYANGPWAHLFTGVYEQHFIPHAMAYASCIGSRSVFCRNGKS